MVIVVVGLMILVVMVMEPPAENVVRHSEIVVEGLMILVGMVVWRNDGIEDMMSITVVMALDMNVLHEVVYMNEYLHLIGQRRGWLEVLFHQSTLTVFLTNLVIVVYSHQMILVKWLKVTVQSHLITLIL